MAKEPRQLKTNALRELERAGIAFVAQAYADEVDGSPASGYGVHVAELLGKDPDATFKTLVCQAASGGHVVCCIPVAMELDLKKAAAAAGEKSLSMLPMRDLEATTGYVRGGCSPVGMKKAFPTLIDEVALLFDEIGISGRQARPLAEPRAGRPRALHARDGGGPLPRREVAAWRS